MRVVRFAGGLVAATLVYVFALRLFPPLGQVVDPFLVLVVYASLDGPPAATLLAGSAAGLVQDALTGGLYGLHGFANTLVAWITARLRQHLVIGHPLQVGLLFALGAGLQQAVVAVLQFLWMPGSEMPAPVTTAARIAVSGILGVAVYRLAGRSRRWARTWRERRRRRLRLEVPWDRGEDQR